MRIVALTFIKSAIICLSSSVLEYKSENVNLNEYQIATEFDTRFIVKSTFVVNLHHKM